MTKNPFLNAFGAGLYIVAIVFVMTGLQGVLQDKEDTLFMPVLMLSLFVLSAGMMGYIFLYQTLQLFLENKKAEATTLFLKTLVTFAGITALFLAAALFLPL